MKVLLEASGEGNAVAISDFHLPMSNHSIPLDHATPFIAETAALIGLGRRGCVMARQIHQLLDIPSCTLLVGDDPVVRPDETEVDAGAGEISPSDPLPDFSVCDLMGVILVGAEYHNPEAVRRLQHRLAENRPALLLGIILSPPAGEPVRLDPLVRAECDCLIEWRSDHSRPDDSARLALAVSDWLSPVLGPGLICIDLSDVIIAVSQGQPQMLRMGSADASFDQPQVAAQAALADLCTQGVNFDYCLGILVTIRVGSNFEMEHFETVGHVFQALPLPESCNLALSTPMDETLTESALIRVTVFAAFSSVVTI